MKKLYLYIHGKGGSYKEAEIFKSAVKGDVIGVDYDNYTPVIASEIILKNYLELAPKYDEVNIIANSIGAWFCMLALKKQKINKAYFISPVVDMEKLITDMMLWANISEKELKEKREIETDFGETLSWDYLCFVRNNPVSTNYETHILYGENDDLIDFETVQNFAKKNNCTLTILKNGEHWFHTKEQIDFLLNWLKKY